MENQDRILASELEAKAAMEALQAEVSLREQVEAPLQDFRRVTGQWVGL